MFATETVETEVCGLCAGVGGGGVGGVVGGVIMAQMPPPP